MNKQKILDDVMLEQSEGQWNGLTVNNTSEVPTGYKGLVLHVNDHGNVSLYKAFKNGSLHLIVDRV